MIPVWCSASLYHLNLKSTCTLGSCSINWCFGSCIGFISKGFNQFLPNIKSLVVQHLEIRNSLDVLHCEKSFCKNVLKTICGFKEKDSVRVRRDMQREGIKKHFWMVRDPQNSSRMLKPWVNYVLTQKEFDVFWTRLEILKVPSRYCSEIECHIRNKKFGALESHDYHILMQTLLPLALRRLIVTNTRNAIMQACWVFRRISCKVLDPE